MFRFDTFLEKNQILIIAELANAFEGKKDVAFKMIDVAQEAGVDALKFQVFFAEELMVSDHPKYNLFKGFETTKADWKEILEYACKTHKLIFVDIFGKESFHLSQNFKVDAYKIPSSDMTNYDLIRLVSSSGKPLILSSGGATMGELQKAIDICRENKSEDIVIVHGFQGWPTRIEDASLNKIEILKKKFNYPVGYADHTDGGSEMALLMPVLAAAKGAQVIEKHFTLDRALKTTDYYSSVNPVILKKMVQYIRNLELIFGDDSWELSPAEQSYRQEARKRLVARKDLKVGEKVSKEDIIIKRAPSGLFAEDLDKIPGKYITKEIKKNSGISFNQLKQAQ